MQHRTHIQKVVINITAPIAPGASATFPINISSNFKRVIGVCVNVAILGVYTPSTILSMLCTLGDSFGNVIFKNLPSNLLETSWDTPMLGRFLPCNFIVNNKNQEFTLTNIQSSPIPVGEFHLVFLLSNDEPKHSQIYYQTEKIVTPFSPPVGSQYSFRFELAGNYKYCNGLAVSGFDTFRISLRDDDGYYLPEQYDTMYRAYVSLPLEERYFPLHVRANRNLIEITAEPIMGTAAPQIAYLTFRLYNE